MKQSDSERVEYNYLCGVIDKADELRFKKTVFVASKGNSFVVMTSFDELFDDPELSQEIRNRDVYYILYPGRKGSVIHKKLNRLVDNYTEKKL